jgi:hypothetical protein
MSTDTPVLGTARTNATPGSVAEVKVRIDEELLLLDPSNDELLIVPREHARAFLQEANHMHQLAAELAQSRNDILNLEEKLTALVNQPSPPVAGKSELERNLKLARARYDKAYEAVGKELKAEGYLTGAGNGKELLELIPLARRKDGKPMEWGRKWTYVRSDRMRNHFRKYKLSAKDSTAGQPKSFIRNGRVDPKAFKEQLGKLEPKIKAEWKLETAGHLLPNLQAWASAINVQTDERRPVQFGAQVHLFRYFAGTGAAVEWNPAGGKIAGKLNGKAELMLAQGQCEASGFVPGPAGCAWALRGVKSGREFLIGEIRLAAAVKLSAAAGASVAAELGIEVDYSAASGAAVKGKRRSSKAPATPPRKVSVTDLQAEGSAGAEAFAGVRAACELKGGLQYRSPEKNDDFDYIAAIGPKLEGQLGAGAAAAFLVDYQKGKFRMKVQAGLCFGPGAKGELGLEVDTKRLVTFMEWFFHALLNANFELLQVVTKTGFEAATQLQVMLVNGLQDAYGDVAASWRDFENQIEREDRNVALMRRVLSNPPELRLCTPEAHGIILHYLTRHGRLTKLNPVNTGWSLDLMGERKKAVLQVCRWAQTRRQFENIVQHIGPNGEKGGFKGNLQGLLRFMEIGPFDSSYDDELMKLYQRLPFEPASGYAVVQNHTARFMAQARIGAKLEYQLALRSGGHSNKSFA